MKAHCAPRPQPRALRGAATRTLAPLRPTRRAAVHSNRISSLQKRQFSPQRFDLMGRNAVRKSTRVPCTPSRLEEENAAGRVMAPFCRHRTIPGCDDAYRQCSTRSNPRLMRGAPPRRTAACTRRSLRHGSDRGSLHRDMIKTRPSSSTRPPVTSQMTQTTHSADSTRSGSG